MQEIKEVRVIKRPGELGHRLLITTSPLGQLFLVFMNIGCSTIRLVLGVWSKKKKLDITTCGTVVRGRVKISSSVNTEPNWEQRIFRFLFSSPVGESFHQRTERKYDVKGLRPRLTIQFRKKICNSENVVA
jgi:hypothetical protein